MKKEWFRVGFTATEWKAIEDIEWLIYEENGAEKNVKSIIVHF